MTNRDFSDSVKLSAITENLKSNNGDICCAACGIKLLSITECHFDHIFPFAKGGSSTLENCQILCINCNLKKTDKELQDFLLEEKAKRFFAGETAAQPYQKPVVEDTHDSQKDISKEVFDQIIQGFIERKGDIHAVDFGREYNHLPSIHYVRKYYGDLNALKKAFGIEDLSYNWNRETIKNALIKYVEQNGNILQKDLTKGNKLPSLPCILSYYPEYKNFTDIKQKMCNLPVRKRWTLETAIQAGEEYVKKHGKITENKLCSENHLPNSKVVYTLFGSIAAYQQAVGSELSIRNEYISKEKIRNTVNQYFGNGERIVESMQVFFQTFPYSSSTIHERFGSFSSFCDENKITVLKSKKARFTKQEVDDAVAKWIKAGNDTPNAKDLNKVGLPSLSVILKYYEDWKEPFVMYRKLYDKLNK